ncbi:GNAT family N-acetyltransferase [Halorussus amylolyticus]|uniref:GNAT family N-acetyltransferase n=1 Tax=Halorussus amylolyticus TaxID=1126242 RepID=UPI00138EF6E7|nr:GNAT family N-acetyltransferase [Halorussus amylolyticus]
MNATDFRRGRDDPYTIQPYAREHRDGVLDLDETVWNRRRCTEWFAWKYERNPYLSEVPVYVATFDGKIVGARPLLAFRLAANGTEFLALQPSDTMVHPDHRGRGLFTRMTERAIDDYTDREPALFFNFPNGQARPGYRKLGWRTVGDRVTYYRIQNPKPLLSAYVDSDLGTAVGSVADPALAGYNGLHDWAADAASEFRVERVDGVPADSLAALYRRRVPDRIHAVRDEEFYRWRFASPEWTRRTYLAVRDGDPVAGVIARTRTNADGIRLTQVADVVPLVGDEGRLGAVASVFGRLLADHRNSDLVAISESPLPHSFLRERGFHRNDRFPFSRLKSHHRVLAVRPLDANPATPWAANGVSLTDESNWLVSFAERDTA